MLLLYFYFRIPVFPKKYTINVDGSAGSCMLCIDSFQNVHKGVCSILVLRAVIQEDRGLSLNL